MAAFGQILSEEILTMPKYGCVNIHASLLPKYRGAGPIQWVGRKLPYMFFDKDAKNIIEASITLNRTAKIIGRTCNNEELDILAKYSRLGSKKKWLTILGAIIFTLILVILIITLK